VSSDRGKALELIDQVVRLVSEAEVVAIARDVMKFDAPDEAVADKASAADDFVVPEEWKQ